MITKGVFSTALSVTVLAASTALGAGVADDGDAALDNTTLLGPVVTPIFAPGLATNAAQNVPATLCAVSSPILGVRERARGDELRGCRAERLTAPPDTALWSPTGPSRERVLGRSAGRSQADRQLGRTAHAEVLLTTTAEAPRRPPRCAPVYSTGAHPRATSPRAASVADVGRLRRDGRPQPRAAIARPPLPRRLPQAPCTPPRLVGWMCASGLE